MLELCWNSQRGNLKIDYQLYMVKEQQYFGIISRYSPII